MAARSVVWTETARRQRRAIFEYWNKRNGNTKYSEKLLTYIQLRIAQLLEYPLSGIESEFEEIRVTSLGHFSLIYRVTDTQLIIMGFWDTRQDPEKLKSSL